MRWLLGAAGAAALVPTPIGVGPGYHPAPAAHAVPGLRCADAAGARFGIHVELFAHRRAIVVPAGIGVARSYARRHGRIVPGGCTYPLRTLAPTGVVEVRKGTRATLGDLFRIWGRPLGPERLLGFHGRVRAYVAGRLRPGDPRGIPLARHAQIVLELGGYVPPHAVFTFPGGL